MKTVIYAVEDDTALRELYQYTLENDFVCLCFNDGEAFFKGGRDAKICLYKKLSTSPYIGIKL